MANFFVHFTGLGNGISHGGAEEFTETFAQAMDGDAGGSLTLAEVRGDLGVGDGTAIGGEAVLQAFVFGDFARFFVFVPQIGHGFLQQGHGPFAFVKLIGGLADGFGLVFRLGYIGIERDNGLSATTFLGTDAIPFVQKEAFQGDAEKGAEVAFIAVC